MNVNICAMNKKIASKAELEIVRDLPWYNNLTEGIIVEGFQRLPGWVDLGYAWKIRLKLLKRILSKKHRRKKDYGFK